MQFDDKYVAQLIKDVEREFADHLAKSEETKLAKSEEANESAPQVDETVVTSTKTEEQPLVKAEEEKKDEKKEEKPAEKKDEKSDEKPAEQEAAKPAEDKQEAPKEDAPAAEEKPAAEAAPAGDEACDYDEEDIAHMEQMYASMSKSELKAHHDAIRKCLDSQQAEQAPAAPEMDKCGDMSMAKSEENTSTENKPNQEVELLKSELEAQKTKSEELKKSLDAVSEFLTKLVKKTAPQGKAITSMDVIAKSESAPESKELSKSEITAILAKKAAEPSLSKSDREAINNFYLNGGSVNSISHLLK